jgi:hypothetical protein
MSSIISIQLLTFYKPYLIPVVIEKVGRRSTLMPSHHWARSFTVTDEDIEYLTGLLLERETPLKIDDLAHALIEGRLQQEAAALQEKYKDVQLYNPGKSFKKGQRIMFPALDYALGTVREIRAGNNPDYGTFKVIKVVFDSEVRSQTREFAADYSVHQLNQQVEDRLSQLPGASELSADEILASNRNQIIPILEDALRENSDLVSVAGLWFPRSLMLDVNEGHLNLAEAVLDINNGGPMLTTQILEEIGGLGNTPRELQVFSLNDALDHDERFDEVGPVDTVCWYLKRLEPQEVLNTPQYLRYTPVEYESGLLSSDMLALEAEIDDEWSSIQPHYEDSEAVTITLNYPHRRIGTLPINARLRHIFPTARRTPRVWVTLVDGQDGEEYPGWVVRQDRFVFGLSKMYRKHKLPVGAILQLRASMEPGKVIVDFNAHRPRTEYVRLIVPKNNQITFEYDKRSIGAEYDDLMILGADDLTAVDTLFQTTQQSRKSLSSILQNVLTELSRFSPQGTVHAKTLYSAVNVVRRCPPGPIFAALVTNMDFEHVGNNYWKLRAQ